MPDWLSHVLFALILAEVFKVKKKSLLVLGAVIPDLLTKVYLLNYFFKLPVWITFNHAIFHSFIPVIILSLLTALLFDYEYYIAASLIVIGAISHLLLDATTKHFWTTAWYNLFWADQYWVFILALGMVYLIMIFLKKWRIQYETKNNSTA